MSANLAKRAVACKHWRWTPGMRSEVRTSTRRAAYRWLAQPTDGRSYGFVCIIEDKHGHVCPDVWDETQAAGYTVATLQPGPDDLPDLDDCGTLGCLLGLVRLARMDPYWLPTCLDWEGGMAWVIEAPSRTRQTRHESYAAVLVAALEAAP